MDTQGQAAIVSGGASGLGRAAARALAANGAKVAILDINETAAAETARETDGFAIAADVTDAASVEAAVAAARARHGPARIAVNCAGIGTPARTLPAARELARYGIRVVAIAPGLFFNADVAGPLTGDP